MAANVRLARRGKSENKSRKACEFKELAGFLGLVGGAGFEPATPAV
jgi:hypothetical protein